MKIPALFEIDNGTATGTIHAYCTTECRGRSRPGLAAGDIDSADFGFDPVCETCGKKIAGDEMVARVIAEFPDKVELGWVEYDDKLTVDQVHDILHGERLHVENAIADGWLDNRHRHEREEIVDAAKAAGVDIDLLTADDMDLIREDLGQRDMFDGCAELLRHTGPMMLRLAVPDPDEAGERLTNTIVEWNSTEDEILDEARRIARAVGFTGPESVEFVRTIMAEVGDVGSEISVLWYGDVRPVVDAVSEQTDADGVTHTITFPAGSASLLILSRGNGSGFEGMPLPEDVTLPLQVGNVDVDHRGSGAWGYSWSDDVAGVVYSAYRSDPTITREETTC